MSDQIDPAFKAAYRETQGQPVDAVGRAADDNDGFVTADAYVDALLCVDGEGWKQTATEYAQEIHNLRTALAEKDARIAELLAADEVRARVISRLTFERDASRAECEGLRAALLLTAGALQAGARTMAPEVAFTGEWAHLGKHRVSDILDKADAALSQKETGDVE